MKKLIGWLALLAAGTACQHQTPPTARALVPMPAVASVAVLPTAAPAPAPADTLTAPMRALLGGYDLAGLWSGWNPEQQTARDTSNAVLDGFFGPDHYRISFIFTQVRRDSADPAVFHVSGKSRYKRQVTPFAGLLKVQQLADLDRRYLDLAPTDSLTKGYTARASFLFQEDPAVPGTGKFEGTGILDFYVSPDAETPVGYAQVMGGEDGPARGQGLLFRGHWVGTKTKQRKEVLLARSIFSIAPDVLKDFALGERDATINPKYAKLGWGNYWENEEWWAASPKLSL
ncbi:MAG: hypothetical protein ACRYFZ_03635 [Janthinobacterium lividum]